MCCIYDLRNNVLNKINLKNDCVNNLRELNKTKIINNYGHINWTCN